MHRIRAFEEAANIASQGGVAAFGQEASAVQAAVRGPLHLSIGQEAVAAGVCAHLAPTDYLTSTHRGHGHTLAKGADPARMMLELFGKEGGYCGGRGGSMHIADFSVGMLGANGVVAAGVPIAVGAAHSLKIQAKPGLAVSFFGDGAINRGPFAEGLNWAATFALPVLFVCEDNQWSATTRTDAMSAGPGADARAEAFGVPAVRVDGMDVAAVWSATQQLVSEIKNGSGPRLLHARTYRFMGHVSVDPAAYRDSAEVDAARQKDPLIIARNALLANGVGVSELEAIEKSAADEIAAAIQTAANAPWPDMSAATTQVQDLANTGWM
ncbi:MAG: thiamine pyrophosphate-dependent dehydrogenase E1 component subunit alpha [Burkholderiaceae bacterium]